MQPNVDDTHISIAMSEILPPLQEVRSEHSNLLNQLD